MSWLKGVLELMAATTGFGSRKATKRFVTEIK